MTGVGQSCPYRPISQEVHFDVHDCTTYQVTLWVCPEYQTVPARGYNILGEYTSRLSIGEAPAVASEETAPRTAAGMVMNFMAVVVRKRRKLVVCVGGV